MHRRLILYAEVRKIDPVSAESSDCDRIDKCLDELSEYFDSVQIFATRHEMGSDGGTAGVVRGRGNWFARIGQVSSWVAQMDENDRVNQRDDASS